MYNSSKYVDSGAAAPAHLEKLRKDYRASERKRNVAAMVDFATNLLTQVGRNKGLRYNVGGRGVTPDAVGDFEKAQERYRKALVDYNGAIAAQNLKKRADAEVAHPVGLGAANNMKFLKPQYYAPYKPVAYMPPGNILRAIENIKKPVWHTNYKK